MITLKSLVDKHGAASVAKACGVTERYVKRCISPNATTTIRTVKLVNAAKKLNDS